MGFNNQTLNDQETTRRTKNLARLQSMQRLEPGWNGYGAPMIGRDALQRAQQFLETIGDNQQPDRVVPSGRGTVQIEYERPNGNYLEIEFGANEIGLLLALPDGEEIEEEDASMDRAIALTRRYHAA